MIKVAILTSGGDAPGMNNLILTFKNFSFKFGIEPFYVQDGFQGLYQNLIFSFQDCDIDHLLNKSGGTIIGSSRFPSLINKQIQKQCVNNLLRRGIEYLIVCGGNGSYKGAIELSTLGIKIIGIPVTIDNDIRMTDLTIGFDSALNQNIKLIDSLRDTTFSHKRCILIEIMGRFFSDLALKTAMATNAEIIITNQNKLSSDQIINLINNDHLKNKKSLIVIIAENIYDNLDELAKQIELKTKRVTKNIVLSYLQRGGSPSALDRINSFKMINVALKSIKNGLFNFLVVFNNNEIKTITINEYLESKTKTINSKWIKNINGRLL